MQAWQTYFPSALSASARKKIAKNASLKSIICWTRAYIDCIAVAWSAMRSRKANCFSKYSYSNQEGEETCTWTSGSGGSGGNHMVIGALRASQKHGKREQLGPSFGGGVPNPFAGAKCRSAWRVRESADFGTRPIRVVQHLAS